MVKPWDKGIIKNIQRMYCSERRETKGTWTISRSNVSHGKMRARVGNRKPATISKWHLQVAVLLYLCKERLQTAKQLWQVSYLLSFGLASDALPSLPKGICWVCCPCCGGPEILGWKWTQQLWAHVRAVCFLVEKQSNSRKRCKCQRADQGAAPAA